MSSMETSATEPPRATPALLIMCVARPCFWMTSSANARMLFSLATFTMWVVILRFESPSSLSVSANSFSLTSAIAIPLIFSCDKRTANARPIPDAAPVTTTTLSFVRDIIVFVASATDRV